MTVGEVVGAPADDGTPPILRVEAISAGYGGLDVLHAVSLHVAPREMVAIIGPNGAGKSTVLKAVMGLVRVSAGEIIFADRPITGRRTDQLVRIGIGYVPQGRIVFPQMTVLENLEMGAFTVSDRRMAAEALEYVCTLFPRLAERRGQQAGTLSGGEQQMVAIGRALMTRPSLILLDEPSLGLAPRFVDMVFDQLVALRDEGLAVALVEQNAARALEVAHRGYVLELGRNRYEGRASELAADERVRRLYLGG
jgi:ABC-type branched-subunit amino acid transport system ATPase component